jgi:hypothetical protein
MQYNATRKDVHGHLQYPNIRNILTVIVSLLDVAWRGVEWREVKGGWSDMRTMQGHIQQQ